MHIRSKIVLLHQKILKIRLYSIEQAPSGLDTEFALRSLLLARGSRLLLSEFPSFLAEHDVEVFEKHYF
jgi:hypothetical protein